MEQEDCYESVHRSQGHLSPRGLQFVPAGPADQRASHRDEQPVEFTLPVLRHSGEGVLADAVNNTAIDLLWSGELLGESPA